MKALLKLPMFIWTVTARLFRTQDRCRIQKILVRITRCRRFLFPFIPLGLFPSGKASGKPVFFKKGGRHFIFEFVSLELSTGEGLL